MRRGKRAPAIGAARTDGLVVESIGEETLVYDLETHEAHCLSEAAARIWRVCDGDSTRQELASALAIDVDTVDRAVAELEACRLLDTAQPHAGLSRREMTIKAARAGAVVAAAPLIWSVTGPIPEALAGASKVQACAAFNGHGCGDCQKGPAFCCCCTPAGGSTKNCYPTDLCTAPVGSQTGALGGTCSATST